MNLQFHRQVEFMTSSGRRVKRRNLDERDGTTISRTHRKQRSKHGRLGSRKKSSKSKAMRPQRRSARNALSFFSKMAGGSSDEDDDLESSSLESESEFPDSNTQSIESERSIKNSEMKLETVKDASKDECEDVVKPSAEVQANPGNRRRLVLKLPCRDSKTIISKENTRSECREQEGKVDSFSKACNEDNLKKNHFGPSELARSSGDARLYENVNIRERVDVEKQKQCTLSAGYSGSTIRWGEVKARSSKRLKLGDTFVTDAWLPSNPLPGGPNFVPVDTNGHLKPEKEYGTSSSAGNRASYGDNLDIKGGNCENGGFQGVNAASTEEHPPDNMFNSTMSLQLSPNVDQQDHAATPAACNGSITGTAHLDQGHHDSHGFGEVMGIHEPVSGYEVMFDNKTASQDASHNQEPEKNTLKFRTRSNVSAKENASSFAKLKSVAIEDRSSEHDLTSNSFRAAEHTSVSAMPEEDEGTSSQSLDHSDWNDDGSGSLDSWPDESHYSKKPHLGTSNTNMYAAVYKRSKSSRGRKVSDDDTCGIEGRTSNFNNQRDAHIDGVRRTRSMGTKIEIEESPLINSNSRGKGRYGFSKTARSGGDLTMNGCANHLFDEWKPASKTVGLRSARSRRETYNSNLKPLDNSKYHQTGRKLSWLMLIEHEESYRYIPQLGDEVAYLRQVKKCQLFASS